MREHKDDLRRETEEALARFHGETTKCPTKLAVGGTDERLFAQSRLALKEERKAARG